MTSLHIIILSILIIRDGHMPGIIGIMAHSAQPPLVEASLG